MSSENSQVIQAGIAVSVGVAAFFIGWKSHQWKLTKEAKKLAFGGINKPTSGPQFEQALPKGRDNVDLKLYSLGTPNGIKVTTLLVALGVPFDAFTINIMKKEQFGSGFCEINPNSKIPALKDESNGARVFESQSIMIYLAEKYGKFLPTKQPERAEVLNWVSWVQGSAPYLGNFGHWYVYNGSKTFSPYGFERFKMESQRICDVLDKQLEGKTYVCGEEITLADFAAYPWILCLDSFYKARKELNLDSYKNLNRWMQHLEKREDIQLGKKINRPWDNPEYATYEHK